MPPEEPGSEIEHKLLTGILRKIAAKLDKGEVTLLPPSLDSVQNIHIGNVENPAVPNMAAEVVGANPKVLMSKVEEALKIALMSVRITPETAASAPGRTKDLDRDFFIRDNKVRVRMSKYEGAGGNETLTGIGEITVTGKNLTDSLADLTPDILAKAARQALAPRAAQAEDTSDLYSRFGAGRNRYDDAKSSHPQGHHLHEDGYAEIVKPAGQEEAPTPRTDPELLRKLLDRGGSLPGDNIKPYKERRRSGDDDIELTTSR